MTMPSYWEIGAILFTTICIFLAGRNNVHTWWTGIVGCIFYGVVFYDAKLYADMALQGFFILTGLVGWWMWKKRIATGGEEKPMTEMSMMLYAALIAAGVVAAVLYGSVLRLYTDAAAPMWDSLILTGSAIAQVLLMTRRVQTWPTWIIVNTISVPLYWSRDLHLSAILYAIYWVHAVWATYNWLNLSKKRDAIVERMGVGSGSGHGSSVI